MDSEKRQKLQRPKDVCRRSQALPIVSVELNGTQAPKEAWRALLCKLREAWKMVAQCATWYAGELLKVDNEPLVDGKLPFFTLSSAIRTNLDKMARAQWPKLESQSLYAVRQRVLKKCILGKQGQKFRYRRRILCQETSPKFTNPQPLPVPEKDFRIYLLGNGQIQFAFKVLTKDWVTVKLGGGSGFHRQYAIISRCLAEMAKPLSERDNRYWVGEAVIFWKRRSKKAMVAITTNTPEPKKTKTARSMELQTDDACFLRARIDGCDDWILNGDHIRRKDQMLKKLLHKFTIDEQNHQVYRQRMSEDTKYEKRWPRKNRRQINRALAKRCDVHRDRRKGFIGPVIKSVVQYAARNGVDTIVYDDSNRKYFDHFCWSDVRLALAKNCQEMGLELIFANEEPEEEAEELNVVEPMSPTTEGV